VKSGDERINCVAVGVSSPLLSHRETPSPAINKEDWWIMYQGSRPYNHKTDTLLSVATVPVIEHLEGRRLFAADIVPVEWKGQTIEARAGEWIVGLNRPEPIFDAEEGVVKSNVQYTRAKHAPELQGNLDRLGLGLKFEQYLGAAHSFLVNAPPNLLYEQLAGALSNLVGFEFVEPNGMIPG
jgi:hypothetical protein